jgi:hypothetical protein
MTTGANLEIDPATRIANLEAALFGGPNPAGGPPFPPFPGASQPQVVVLTGATDAIAIKTGKVILNTAGVDATTLANPVAGAPGIGDDGKTLAIFVNTANAHTVTTGAHGIDGNKNIATSAGAIGNFLELFAWNGQWCVQSNSGFTLSGS